MISPIHSPGGETIDWIAGAYYQYNELDISRRIDAIDFAQSAPLDRRAGALSFLNRGR